MSESNFIKLMGKLLTDEAFKHTLPYNKAHSFFEIMGSVWERESSDFIAWLIDANESHGTGDFFIKQLLYSRCREIKSPIISQL